VSRLPRPAMPVTSAELARQFPGWRFAFDGAARVWTAERRSGTSLRFVVAHEAHELAAKIERIEAGQ